MRLLLVGSGAREHALAQALAKTKSVSEIFVAPGNPGIALEPKVTCLPIAVGEFEKLANYCQSQRLDFAVIGPDQPLADGIVDYFESRKIAVFGPTAAAAKIEASKAFSKQLMKAAQIPTAKFEVFHDFATAQNFLQSVNWGDGWVIKADGLALGKGVVVCANREEALTTAKSFLEGGAMGAAGKTIVVEECLLGRETSGFFLCDGKTAVCLGYACDYKQIFDGGMGPNTGGMGSYSPVDWLDSILQANVADNIVHPLLQEMAKQGAPYKGILFVGLMITKAGPKVIEFNARFGDPETQSLLPLLDEELLPWLQAAQKGLLHEMPAAGPKKKLLTAVHVVLAAHGYPGGPGQEIRKGDLIQFPAELLPTEEERRSKLYFAGVTRKGTDFVTNGGRVMGLTVLAHSRSEARRIVYELLPTITFEGMQRRSDVGL